MRQRTGCRTLLALVFAVAATLLPSALEAQQAPQPPGADIPAAKPPAPDSNTPPGYRIGEGDVLTIDVWKEPEASIQSVMVRPDGKITIPLLKEIYVLDLTPTELEKLLASKLEPMIHGADVTVVVREIKSKKVYLVGAVKREGTLPLLSNMSVLQVLSEAGGLTDFAKRKKIYVLRKQGGQQKKILFNYDQVIKGEHMEQNIQVLPDDTIVVPH